VFTIIDRRPNPKGKSLANRQRFLRRARAQVLDAVAEASGRRRIADVADGEQISIPADRLHEPGFRKAASGGNREYTLPGNHSHVVGDRLRRPDGSGAGAGGQGSEQGGGDDAFTFALSRDEFLDLYFDGLELPDLAKRRVRRSEQTTQQRAGYAISGTPSNLNIERTLRNALARRIALRRPNPVALQELDEEIARLEHSGDEPERLTALIAQRAEQIRRLRSTPWIDPVDIRYNRHELIRQPVSQAVMFCLMDVSGSMTEDMKDLAKRFFSLLYLFLERCYRHVDLVFIRHTHIAQEVDEETFFYSRETGGTLVSPALELMRSVIDARYPAQDWNIYGAQASDGDNTPSDNQAAATLMAQQILPLSQYFAYIEVGPDYNDLRPSDLWRTYSGVDANAPQQPLVMRRVRSRRDIFPVFRDLFTPN
jgi:uncharacterized protein